MKISFDVFFSKYNRNLRDANNPGTFICANPPLGAGQFSYIYEKVTEYARRSEGASM